MDLQRAYTSTTPAEVTFEGRVTSAPQYFYGRRTHCVHEAFHVQTQAGTAEVVDNVAIAPRVPVRRGDEIAVRGEMVHDPGRSEPLVHWTHHDPAGQHEDGFIRLGGRVYA